MAGLIKRYLQSYVMKKAMCILAITFMLAGQIISANKIVYGEPTIPLPSRVIITSYSISGGGLVAGETRRATFVLENTSVTAYISSVLVTGRIESTAPVYFVGTNQVYIGRIPPGGNVEVVFEYYTQRVDMAAVGRVYAGLTVQYADEATRVERINNITVHLPVLLEVRTPINEEQMQWQMRELSRIDSLLYSSVMQALYLGIIVFCVIWIVLLILFKFGILKRR